MRQLIDELIEINARNSKRFCDPGLRDFRKRFRNEHKVRELCFKCMDGRLNFSLLTGTPMGLIIPFRNIGGIFDMGWPALSERVCGIVENATTDGYANLFSVTYHFAKGDMHRGCRGMDYDLDKGRANAMHFVSQIERVFGSGHEQVYPIMVGVETDDDLLVFHDRGDKRQLTTLELMANGSEQALAMIRDLYPDMAAKMAKYLLHHVEGNLAHIEELRKHPRPPIVLSHTERVLALGTGFDWLHHPTLAIIVNPYHPMLDDAVGTAAGIIIGNRDAERISADNVLLFPSVGYYEQGHQYTAAKEQARYLARLGREAINKFHPTNGDFFHDLVGVVNMYERKLEILTVNGHSV